MTKTVFIDHDNYELEILVDNFGGLTIHIKSDSDSDNGIEFLVDPMDYPELQTELEFAIKKSNRIIEDQN